ncbi:hypothetical protein O181_041578 [Austropuccinia psidii MF-1]|uniref:Uncharacterized protein n=1 Tax=Austropuccinia psidii MF-1 TaxID=1389203 RepID=A0A9Q3HDX7_9BASI|nr:hypothetical protein [Austropuccinia psidii MF-1]
MHSNPEDLFNEDGPETSYGPNQPPKTLSAILGKVRFEDPAPSQWAQAMRVKLWSHGPPGTWHVGCSNSHGPHIVGYAKDKKVQKGPS